MKFRGCWVSNSSSSSFITFNITKETQKISVFLKELYPVLISYLSSLSDDSFLVKRYGRNDYYREIWDSMKDILSYEKNRRIKCFENAPVECEVYNDRGAASVILETYLNEYSHSIATEHFEILFIKNNH